MEAQHFLKLAQWEFKMETLDAIKERRSIRHFNTEEVSVSNLKEIIDSGILSPSGHNRQPWHFIIIHKDKALKNKGDLLENKIDLTTIYSKKASDKKYKIVIDEINLQLQKLFNHFKTVN